MWKAEAEVKVEVGSEGRAKAILEALKPEMKTSLSPRSRVRISIKKDVLILRVAAKDTVALRASLNSYLRFILSLHNVAGSIMEMEGS